MWQSLCLEGLLDMEKQSSVSTSAVSRLMWVYKRIPLQNSLTEPLKCVPEDQYTLQ